MQLGYRLKLLRKQREMSQKELAGYLNISAKVIDYYEANDCFTKDSRTLIAIANISSVSLDYLLRQDLSSLFSYSELL